MRVFLLALSSFVWAGCVAEVAFDPIGDEATMQGSWTLDGAAASEEGCAERSITHVRVRFFVDDGGEDDAYVDHPDLVFPCEAGAFDTRPDGVVRSGRWTVQVLALDNYVPVGQDNTVAGGPIVGVSSGEGHIVVPAVDFAP